MPRRHDSGLARLLLPSRSDNQAAADQQRARIVLHDVVIRWAVVQLHALVIDHVMGTQWNRLVLVVLDEAPQLIALERYGTALETDKPLERQ